MPSSARLAIGQSQRQPPFASSSSTGQPAVVGTFPNFEFLSSLVFQTIMTNYAFEAPNDIRIKYPAQLCHDCTDHSCILTLKLLCPHADPIIYCRSAPQQSSRIRIRTYPTISLRYQFAPLSTATIQTISCSEVFKTTSTTFSTTQFPLLDPAGSITAPSDIIPTTMNLTQSSTQRFSRWYWNHDQLSGGKKSTAKSVDLSTGPTICTPEEFPLFATILVVRSLPDLKQMRDLAIRVQCAIASAGIHVVIVQERSLSP